MSCPICGANCRCRARGPGGICCSCHKHKPRRTLGTWTVGAGAPPEILVASERHMRAAVQLGLTLRDQKDVTGNV